jgi:hypothetical protein
MLAASTPSFGALLHHGGAGGVNRTGRRLWRPLLFAPLPPGTGTAAPPIGTLIVGFQSR